MAIAAKRWIRVGRVVTSRACSGPSGNPLITPAQDLCDDPVRALASGCAYGALV